MADDYEITGTVKQIMEPKTFAKGFTKREFVLLTEDQYPQTVLFECIKDKCGLLDQTTANDRVAVTFRVRGREWQGKFFVNLETVAIAKLGAGQEEPAPVTPDDVKPDDTEPPF